MKRTTLAAALATPLVLGPILSSCDFVRGGQAEFVTAAEDYVAVRAEEEDQIVRAGEVILCRRMTVGAKQRRYGGRDALLEHLEGFCSEIQGLP